ncbi:MAG: MFS transporter [Bacillota bacterium]
MAGDTSKAAPGRRDRSGLTHPQMALYAAGTGGAHLLNTTVVTWIAYFYVAPEGSGRVPLVSLAAFTLAMTLGRIVDALVDLPVAYLSDRTPGRLGRRIPYILFGGLPLIVIFVLLWTPPGSPGSTTNALWFALTINLFFIAFTAVFNPQGALLPEIARTSRERVTVSTYNATFTMLTAAVAMIAPGILVERVGFTGMALVVGSLALVMTYCPVLVIRERPRTRDEVPKVTFAETLVMVFRNRPFLHYEFNMAAFYVGFNVLLAGVPFFVKVVLGQPEGLVGLYLGAHLAAAMAVFPFVGPLARRFGKRRLYLWGIGSIALIAPLLFFVGKLPLPLSPGTQALILLTAAGLPLGVLYVLPGALISDCVDYDEGRTGTRREAIYVGVQNILQNAAVAVSTVTMMTVFNLFGFGASNPTGIYLLGPLAGLMFLVAFLIFRPYELDEKRHPEWAARRWQPPGPGDAPRRPRGTRPAARREGVSPVRPVGGPPLSS